MTAPPTSEPTTTTTFRAIEEPRQRCLEDLDDDDVRHLTAFLQTRAPGSGLQLLAALGFAAITIEVVDHPFINWMSVTAFMTPACVIGMYLPHRRRLQRFLREDLGLDDTNARALFIFTVWLSHGQVPAFARVPDLIVKARARRDGTG